MPRLLGISQNLISTKNKETKTSICVIGSAPRHFEKQNQASEYAKDTLYPDSQGQYRTRGSHRRSLSFSHTHSLSFLFIF